MMNEKNAKSPVYLVGSIVGLIIGLVGAHLYLRAAEESNTDTRPRFETGDILRFGVTALAVMRQITEVGARGKRG
jgi:hypothetical protein